MITFFGYKIEGFEFKQLYHQFGEIFVRSMYYFKTTNKAPIIIDCGSNIGFSVIFFKFLYPNSTILAFEPEPKTFEKLKKNVIANHLHRVHLHNLAITNQQGDIDYYVDSKTGSESSSSFPESGLKSKMKVKATTLSKYIKTLKLIDFMKIDIEGYEYLVFKNLAKKNLLKNQREMII